MKLKELFSLRKEQTGGFVTRFNEDPDHALLVAQIGQFYGLSGKELLDSYIDYKKFYNGMDYQSYFSQEKDCGERKHLCMEEAMLCYFTLRFQRPDVIVEIGTQYGVSTRKIIDIRNHLGIDAPIVCYDIEDQVKYFTPVEATLNVKDVSQCLRVEIFINSSRGYLHLDAHPYYLTRDAILEATSEQHWAITMHDCGRGLCNPKMEISRDQPELISSLTGHWERHVLAEVFGVSSPLEEALDSQETPTHSMRIFETPHGGCVILPKKDMGD